MTLLRCLISCVFVLAIWPAVSTVVADEQPAEQPAAQVGQRVYSESEDLRADADSSEAADVALRPKERTGETSSNAIRFEVVLFVMVGLVLLLFLLIRPSPAPASPPVPQVEAPSATHAEDHPEEVKTETLDAPAPSVEMSDRVAIELALQTWRLEKRIQQLPLSEHPKLLRRMEDSIKKLTQLLADHQVVIDDPLHRKYVDGWVEVEAIAWEAVTADEYPDGLDEGPFVHETRRPIVRRNNRPIAKGQVVLAEK